MYERVEPSGRASSSVSSQPTMSCNWSPSWDGSLGIVVLEGGVGCPCADVYAYAPTALAAARAEGSTPVCCAMGVLFLGCAVSDAEVPLSGAAVVPVMFACVTAARAAAFVSAASAYVDFAAAASEDASASVVAARFAAACDAATATASAAAFAASSSAVVAAAITPAFASSSAFWSASASDASAVASSSASA